MNELYDKLLDMRKRPTILLDLNEIKLFQLDQRQHLTFRERLNPVCRHLADRYRLELLNFNNEQFICNYQSAVLRAVVKVFGRLKPESHNRPIDIFTLCKLTEAATAEAIQKPNREAPGKLREIYSMLQAILEIAKLPENTGMIRFYELIISRILRQVEEAPGTPVIECALKHLRMHRERHRSMKTKSILWGKEFDGYLKKYLKQKFREKTAKTYARRDFIAAHPLPKNPDEILDSGVLPGHTMAALRRYHRTYLDSITKS